MAKPSMTISVDDSVKLRSDYAKTGKVISKATQGRVVVEWANGTTETLRPIHLIVTEVAQ